MQPNISCSLHYFHKLFYQKQLMQPTQPNISCSFPKLFYQKQLMQPNCQIPTHAAQQLFPQTFLSKTAHAAQLPNPHPMQPNIHAAISNDFSIKNSSCSYFQRLFYQKQLMQPNFSIKNSSCPPHHAAYTISTRLFYQKQLMQHAAISNDFSIKNSPTPSVCSKSQRLFYQKQLSVCSYFQRLFYQKQLMQPNCQIPTLGMQLFPTTFLSKTAHAAQLPNPHPRYAAISNDFSIKNSSCSPTAKSPPSVCSYFQRLFYQKQLMQPTKEKKGKKITINITQPTSHTNTTHPTSHHHHLHHHHHHLHHHHLTTTSSYTPPAHTPPTKHPHKHTLH
jgi:hypothetical protein